MNIEETDRIEDTKNIIEIKSIKDLLTPKYKFFIPAYQRGYRWTESQVKDLLDDIYSFNNKDKDSWYCLQPVIVKKSKEEEEKYEVIDGQQRLTTIYLILKYLSNDVNSLFSIEYDTRKKSAEFLNIKYKNIDYYHINSAYETIHNWVNENKNSGFDCKAFQSKFKTSTKVIWYEIKDIDSESERIDIFTRINMGKIPLTNAELIKALLLNSSNFGTEDTAHLRLRQLEIASEWDRIEYALQNDELWYFINHSENKLATRIEFIFNIMEENKNGKNNHDPYSTFRFFSEKFDKTNEPKNEIISKNWKEVKGTFLTIEDWYEDRELYHKIGFLIATGTKLNEILKESDGKTKGVFKSFLNKKIIEKIKIKIKIEKELDELDYYDDKYNIKNILLLHNILTMLSAEDVTNKFPFDRYKDKKTKWDIEHIHAVASEMPETPNHQADWLTEHYEYIKEYDKDVREIEESDVYDSKKKKEFFTKKIENDDNYFTNIFNTIINDNSEDEDNGNSIANLCLLDASTNRSYKNGIFSLKRKKIIERDRDGTFIPICTRNVFLKYYSDNVEQMTMWSKSDKENYLNDIKEKIKRLNGNENNEANRK